MTIRTPHDSWSESYQRGVIDALEVFHDSMVSANCECDFSDAIELCDDAISEQIFYYEEHFGTWVPTLLAAEIQE